MTPEHDILQVTPRVEALAALCRSNSRIDPALYRKYDVKRGLRDINGQGVLAGLTNISDIISRKEIGGEIVPCEGEQFHPRCHHESTDPRHDEQPVAQCAHAGILRQQCG